MNSNGGPTVVIAPGLRDHVAEHSQTLLADRLDRVRVVPPLAHDKLRPAARIAALDAVFAQVEGPGGPGDAQRRCPDRRAPANTTSRPETGVCTKYPVRQSLSKFR